jgi:chorismate-pyruvate lyase
MAARMLQPDTSSADRKLLYPLEDFYISAGEPLPRFEKVDGEDVPEPYNQLLVHNGDMTPRLENFHKASIHLEVIHSRRDNNRYTRQVILRVDGSNKPVEFGAIEINLALFDDKSRNDILLGTRPLGGILRDHTITHSSWPKAFLRLESDWMISAALASPVGSTLYGRRNTLFAPNNEALAEIVEILPV